MGKQKVANKETRELIRIATANGGRVVFGSNHILIYDGNFLVAALARGTARDKVPGGNKSQVLKRFRKRGWNA